MTQDNHDDQLSAIEAWQQDLDNLGPLAETEELLRLLGRCPMPRSKESAWLVGFLYGKFTNDRNIAAPLRKGYEAALFLPTAGAGEGPRADAEVAYQKALGGPRRNRRIRASRPLPS